MRTLVFQIPDRDLQTLVTIYDDDHVTIAFRPGHGSWGPPIQSMTEQHRPRDLDSGPRPLPDYMKGQG